ncbi:hypothetical protein ACFWAR_30870 [Streptomyces sp. NPDC059917]|uniref:hypothetical protein n=1 Tax=Streptomyces sp. NPDC059917 TaxID=3347002 RepID=UPI00365549AB
MTCPHTTGSAGQPTGYAVVLLPPTWRDRVIGAMAGLLVELGAVAQPIAQPHPVLDLTALSIATHILACVAVFVGTRVRLARRN